MRSNKNDKFLIFNSKVNQDNKLIMNFFSKIFKGSDFLPPEKIDKLLKQRFHEVMNIEWSVNGDNYEAIFYKNSFEYIALYNKTAQLLEYKVSLAEQYLPQIIMNHLINKGEVMNVVLINKGNSIAYEIIYRNSELIRYMIVFDELGTVVAERLL